MIASRTTRFPNAVALSALLVLVVLATAALFPLMQALRQTPAGADAPVVRSFPYSRLNEFRAYRLSEWGVASPAPTQAPWLDLSQLPAGYVQSEKGGPASHPAILDVYGQLMTVK